MKLGVVMDPIESINIKKDTSFAMLLAAQARGWALSYMELDSLLWRQGECYAHCAGLEVKDDPQGWFTLGETTTIALADLDVVLMRKDPPFNMEYIYATYLLEQAERAGVLVVNKPQSLRDANEKLYTAWFPQCCPPNLVGRRSDDFKAFLREHGDIVVKPLDGMGGASIFRVTRDDPNVNVILETITNHQSRFAMAQRYIPDIVRGDKRILMIDGEPVPYALARIPTGDDIRGNLAVGARAEGVELSKRDRWICEQVGPTLRERGLIFVGLDVIGDNLTEINVTSPTCIRELDHIYSLDIAGDLMRAIERKRAA